jgi:hypothetical protein
MSRGGWRGLEEFQADSDREECRTECVGAKPRRLDSFCIFVFSLDFAVFDEDFQ